MTVIVFDPYVDEELLKADGCESIDFSLLRVSDFIFVHATLSPETHHMVDSKSFSMMKNTAVLINTSRGAIVDEKALYEALKKKLLLQLHLMFLRMTP